MTEEINEIEEEIEEATSKKRSPFVNTLIRLVKEKPLGTMGAVVTVLFILIGIFANLSWIGLPKIGIAPYGYNDIHLADRLQPPSTQYLLGTDNLGRDLLSRLLYGARYSMLVGISVSFFAVCIAVFIGSISGYIGGKLDLITQRVVDAFMCIPPLIFILTILAVTGPGLLQVILVLGILYGVGNSRVIRSAVLVVKENIYVTAATSIGAKHVTVLLKHILPNIVATILIIFTVDIGAAIISEATVSFLGYGIPAPIPSWGGMLSRSSRQYMLQAPWMAFWPGLCLGVVVYGINMLGDALRDIFDPRLRGGLGKYGGLNQKKITKLLKKRI